MPDPRSSADTPTVVTPHSLEEVVAAFRDGEPPVVVGGGTIVVPDVQAGRLRPRRALLLGQAGLDTITRGDGVVRIGAEVTLDRLGATPAPLGTVASGVADREIRAQATIGGNLCARSRESVPRGDLQVPLIALGARVRVLTAHSEELVDVEDFLRDPVDGKLVLGIEVDESPRRTGTARLSRPHTHSYTALHVCVVATTRDGRLTGVRAVAGGLDDVPVRLRGVEAEWEDRAIDDADPAVAARRALEGVRARTDALASAWYREKVLPVLVRRAGVQLLGREENGQ